MENINKVLITLSMWGYSEATKKKIEKKISEGREHTFRNGMKLSELIQNFENKIGGEMKMENTITIGGRKFLIFDSIENESNIDTVDTILDTIQYSVESTDSQSVELFYITKKPDFEAVGYAIEV